jgi:transcriptional regulator with XRE-family HTH domain
MESITFASTSQSRQDLVSCYGNVGRHSRLHRTYIGRLERGEINPSLLNIMKVSAALRVDVGELVRSLSKGMGNPKIA